MSGRDPRAHSARRLLLADPEWVVPEHWCTEVVSAIRGLWLGNKWSEGEAHHATSILARFAIQVCSTQTLIPRMWELRSSMTAYDAGYVATAELHGCALVTADARIARSGAAECPVRVIDA